MTLMSVGLMKKLSVVIMILLSIGLCANNADPQIREEVEDSGKLMVGPHREKPLKQESSELYGRRNELEFDGDPFKYDQIGYEKNNTDIHMPGRNTRLPKYQWPDSEYFPCPVACLEKLVYIPNPGGGFSVPNQNVAKDITLPTPVVGYNYNLSEERSLIFEIRGPIVSVSPNPSMRFNTTRAGKLHNVQYHGDAGAPAPVGWRTTRYTEMYDHCPDCGYRIYHETYLAW